ncbi:unnamed protein product [Cuscuta campestris]|uniref:CCHC-type domain-containing protein n=1 Tax=Cuscuta campestris TaxID=132261 RepID=A0A484NCV2_9ASTE|nr:unnamed protein product [Cuscuta campestris]
MENPERNLAAPDVVQYIPKPKEKWDDRDCKKHNLDNVAKAAIFKTLDPITFSKIKHLKTAMEIWQGLGKLCEGSEDLRKQKIEVLLEKFKSFKMLPGESFDMLDERFHKILNDLASLNHILSPKEKNVRFLRSLPTEWYTKATAMEEGRNLENYTVQGLLDELRTYEHELKKKKEEQVTPFPMALMTIPRIPSSEGTCTRNCDTPSSSQPSSSKMENYDEEFAMMVKQFRKFKKFFKKADSVRRPSKGKTQVSDSPPESYLCYNYRKPGHWKSACPYPKVEKYGERERNKKKKKAMVAAESDESSSSCSDEEALVCMERRVGKSNHEDRWTMSEDDTLCLIAKDDADQEVTSQTSCSSSYSIPTSENLFDQFKKMMKDFGEINLKHSSLTEENKLLSEENLKLTESRKSQLNEITQLKIENESLSKKVKSLDKELGILKSQEAVNKLLETKKQKGRKGLGFDPSSSKRKGKTTFIPPKPTAKPNKQKGKEKEKPTEVPKKHDHEVLGLSDKSEEVNEGDRMKPTEFIPFRSLPLKTSQRNLDSNSVEPTGNLGQPFNIPDHSIGDNSGNGDPVPIHPETPTSVLQPEAELEQPVNPNQHNLRWLRDHPPQQKLEAKCSSPMFYQSYLEMIAPQELSEFLHMEIRFKYENEVLEFYKNGKAKTVKSKKDPQRTIQVINSTVQGTKKYEARYWLYYLSSKGENRAGASTTAEESSSDNVLIMSLNKSVKRKQVVSPSPSAEAPQNLAPINLEEEEEFSNQGELQRKKKRKITSPSTSGHVNPDELKEKEPTEETSAHNRSPQQLEEEIPQLYYDWRAWKVGNSAEQLLSWDQQLKNEKIIKKCLGLPVNYCCEQILDVDWVWQRNYEDLHLEHLVTSPISEFKVDDEDLAVYKPVLSKTTEDQVVLTSEAQANLETTAEDFQIFLETSSSFETALPEAAVFTPQKQNEEGSNEELQQLHHSEALEILTNPCEITNPTETEIPEKSAENLGMSKTPETNEAQEEQAVEAQRSSVEAEKETQMAELEASKSPVTNFHFDSSSIPTLPDEVPEIWTKKVQGLIESALASQHASFRQEIEQMEARHNKLIEKSEVIHCSNLKEISKSVDKSLEILYLLSNTVSNTMETYASDSYLQLKKVNKIREQIENVTASLQKQMSILQMDIRAALAVSSANQVVTKDYLKVIIGNLKEAHKLSRLLTTNSGNRKMEVVLQQHSPSLIPELPIAVKEGEVSYIPTHLNLTDLVLEAQRSNPENSTQRLSNSGLDGTEAVGTIAAHFSNENQTEERRNNIRRIKELCGNMQGIREIAESSKRKKH